MKSTLDGLAEGDLLGVTTDNASHVVAQRAEKSQVLELVECFVLLAWIELRADSPGHSRGPFLANSPTSGELNTSIRMTSEDAERIGSS